VAGPRAGHRSPRLIYQRLTRTGPTAGTTISASVSRRGARELTATFAPASVGIGYRSLRWQVLSTLRPPACTTLKPQQPCLTAYPGKPALAKLHTPQLIGCQAAGPTWVFHGPSTVHEIALTFDDGPWPDPPTSDFVNLLAREHVPATFFEIGDQISEYDAHGTVEREMLADGDMIGDHTWSHPDMLTLGVAAQRAELAMAAAAIKHATGGFEPCLFRAPYGDVNPALLSLARSMGFTTIQWDVDPADWKLPGVGAIYQNVVSNANNGAIVIQHFGGGPRYETLAALPHEISTLRSRGYKFVTVTQMLGYRLIYR
jgi:peptidoglycan/xylan/chitin deacetylase (PgdA/CDA1 family)